MDRENPPYLIGYQIPMCRCIASSLENLLPALKLAYRAYIFDNSGREARLLAEQTPSGNLNIQREHMPIWFATYVTERLKASR